MYMLEEEIGRSREVWEETSGPEVFVGFLTRHGMEMAERAAAEMRARIPLPEEMLPLYPGEELALGEAHTRPRPCRLSAHAL